MGTIACYTTLRGQGWSWGCRPHQLPAPLPRSGLLLRLVRRIVFYQANCAVASWIVKVAESSSDRSLNELFNMAGLPLPPYWVSFIICGFCLGQAAWSGLELGFACTTLVYWALTNVLRALLPASLRPEPFDHRMFPPLMRPPHFTSSVQDFWSRRWHSMFRRTFTVLGYYPVTTLLGRGALGIFVGTIAAFAISGIAHDYGLNYGVQGANLTYSGWRVFESTIWSVVLASAADLAGSLRRRS